MYKYNNLALFAFFIVTSFASLAGDYQPISTLEPIDSKIAVKYLRKAIADQLRAEDINFDIFQTIYALHTKLATRYEFLAACPLNRIHRDREECLCSDSLYCNFSLTGSFAGRLGRTCCKSDKDKACGNDCGVCLYVPCFPFQLLFGSLLPCGYSDNSYCVEKRNKADQKSIKEYLQMLNGIYAAEYWDRDI